MKRIGFDDTKNPSEIMCNMKNRLKICEYRYILSFLMRILHKTHF